MGITATVCIQSAIIQSAMAAQPSITIQAMQIEPEPTSKNFSTCIQQWLTPLLHQPLNNSGLQLARQNINQSCFYEKGYINSGIIYPDQDFTQHRLQVKVIAGEINQLDISGQQALSSQWYQQQLQPALQQPFQLDHLRESLLLLERHPAIKKVDAKLNPGAMLGQGELDLKITEQRPYQIQFELNNTQASPSVGEAFFNLKANHYSLTGNGDQLGIESSYSQGLKKIALSYRYPINYRSALSINILSGHSEIIEAPFDRLEITNQSDHASIAYEYDLERSLNQTWQLFAGFTFETSESKLLGKNFSFSPGIQNGKSRLSILDLGFRWNRQVLKDRGVDQIWSIENHWQIGVPILSATKTSNNSSAANDDDPDSRFLKVLLQGQWRKKLSRDGKYQLLTRFNAQWSNSPLLPLEVYSMGGINSVRGYRQSQFSRDIGWSVSINLPILIQPRWELTPFIDLGQAWNQDYKNRAKLTSVGVALEWQLNQDWQLYGHYAKRLSETRSQGSSLQDKGFGLQLKYRFM